MNMVTNLNVVQDAMAATLEPHERTLPLTIMATQKVLDAAIATIFGR